MPNKNHQVHDRSMRTPDLLTQEEFDQDLDPPNELSTSNEQRQRLLAEHDHFKSENFGPYRRHYPR